jgi:hypothetical protein
VDQDQKADVLSFFYVCPKGWVWDFFLMFDLQPLFLPSNFLTTLMFAKDKQTTKKIIKIY